MRLVALTFLLLGGVALAQQPAIRSAAPQTAYSQQQTVEKQAIPDDATQKEAAKIIADVYKADYEKAKTSAQKVELASKLLKEAVATRDDPVGRFVLMRIARDIGAQQGDLAVALQAIQAICREYEADKLQMQVDAAAIAVKVAKVAKAHQACTALVLPLIDEALAADRYELAKSVTDLALISARGGEEFERLKQLDARRKEIDEIAAQFDAVKLARQTLENQPTDPEANFRVGSFLCFTKGDWRAGVSMLALGSNEEFKAAALLELDARPDPLKVADAWWQVSESQEGRAQQQTQAHTGQWYRKALPSLSGLTKAKVESRLKTLPDATATVGGIGKVGPEKDFGYSDVWINESYKTTIRRRGKNWIETSHTTGKVTLNYTELDRNERYVELYCIERKHKMRLLKSGKAEFDGKGSWQWIANGHWEK